MAYLTLYRKWRPQQFADVVGQDHITRTVQNALANRRIAHAYLFCGPRGTGKTTLAKLLAKAVNCQAPAGTEPCNQCASCTRINNGTAMDVLEIDGASNRGIDEIRALREKVNFAPVEGRYKVYIIDEVHMLTTEAFNALLKTLEEPPEHVLFIFATTEPHKVLATIRSRCQRFDFRRLRLEDLTGRLRQIATAEGITITDAALRLIARSAEGGMRDAIGIMEQCTAYAAQIDQAEVQSVLGIAGRETVVALTQALASQDVQAALLKIDELVAAGRDLRVFLQDLLVYWRDLLLVKLAGANEVPRLGELTAEECAELAAQGETISQGQLAAWLEVIGEVETGLRYAVNPRLPVELALVKLTRPEVDPSPATLLLRIEALEEQLSKQPPPAQAEAAPTPANPPPREAQAAAAKPKPEAASPQPQGDSDLARIQAAWGEIRQKLKQKHGPALPAYLEVARPTAIRNGCLVLLFPKSHGFHHGNVAKPENKAYIAQAIQQVTGLRLEVEPVLGQEAKAPAPPAPKAGKAQERKTAPTVEDPLVREALALFGGRIIKVEEERTDGHDAEHE